MTALTFLVLLVCLLGAIVARLLRRVESLEAALFALSDETSRTVRSMIDHDQAQGILIDGLFHDTHRIRHDIAVLDARPPVELLPMPDILPDDFTVEFVGPDAEPVPQGEVVDVPLLDLLGRIEDYRFGRSRTREVRMPAGIYEVRLRNDLGDVLEVRIGGVPVALPARVELGKETMVELVGDGTGLDTAQLRLSQVA